MIVGEDQARLRLLWNRIQLLAFRLDCGSRHAECEVAVIALVDRLDQIISGLAEQGRHLKMRNAGAAGHVDGATRQMKAVRHAAHGAIMRWRSIDARDHSIAGGDAGGANRLSQWRDCQRQLRRSKRRRTSSDRQAQACASNY